MVKHIMSEEILELTDGACTNTLLEFISTYFPFIDEPLKLTYRGRVYEVITTQARKFEFEDFFASYKCHKCSVNCCANMYIPIGFAQYWSEEKLKKLHKFKPRRYSVRFNDKDIVYYIGITSTCKFQSGKKCTIWDSNDNVQKRPMGCHFYPMTWYWDYDDTIIFTKHCEPYLCKGESMQYTRSDFEFDLKTFKKLCKEVEYIGLTVNYRPVEALEEQCYFSV